MRRDRERTGQDLPRFDSEERFAEFAALVDTAIANADSRDQLMASRARVFTAGDDARRRVVRDLHDGAQQRLVRTIVTLKLREDGQRVESLLAAAVDDAEQGNAELRELAPRDPPVRAHQRRSPCRRRQPRLAARPSGRDGRHGHATTS